MAQTRVVVVSAEITAHAEITAESLPRDMVLLLMSGDTGAQRYGARGRRAFRRGQWSRTVR
ncbi:hypothetical protein GCM10012280_16970 [Wenjunlia tyrosinilytica]|uniref:Uncharacterized protein n=1 Tax=Wenjunlia tyrosinilytica TaxID=1544741 RepID=A0A918DWF1_9ACTN|nr:hypothetical protein GCM10012280_16970 [Wenjunlia tyrosinilytica]